MKDSVADFYDDYDNVKALHMAIYRNGLPGCKIDICQQSGSLSVESPNHPEAILFATPWWEGEAELCLELHDIIGDGMCEPVCHKVEWTGVIDQDAKLWATALMEIEVSHLFIIN